MKYIFTFLFSVFFLSSCYQKKNNTPFQEPVIYPTYENCEENLTNQEKLKCMEEKISLFYHYFLTHEYAKDIKNMEDSLILWMEIDTLGKMHAYKIEHSSTTNKKLDSLLRIITQQSPIFVPAKYKNQKIPFRFKLPVILTK